MKQLDNVELFVCSEDATQQIGFADKVEVWTEGGSSHLILRGVNGVDKDAVLQAENECLRRDVEFYKKLWKARDGGTTKPTITESQFLPIASRLFKRWPDLGVFMSNLQHELSRLGIEVIPDPEPTNRDKLANILVESFNSVEFDLEDSFREIAAVLDKHGVTAPEGNA